VDIATIAGVFTGVTLILLAIVASSPLTTFFDVPSLMITVGGAVAATFISFPLRTVLSMVAVYKKTILHRLETPTQIIQTIVGYAEKARKEGMLALEDESETEPNEFLRMGLRLAVDGTDPQLLHRIMENDIEALGRRHQTGIAVVQTMGTYAPAFGMIGTLVGLVQMLTNMSSPDSLGQGMAVALLTTFYGALMANVFFLPMAAKLKNRSQEEMALRDLVVEGIVSIQSGDSPRVVEEKLKSYLAPKERAGVGRKRGAE
jgi:chemotaxis protein MotA